MTAVAPCRRCGETFSRSPSAVRKGDWTCQACKREQDHASRGRRKEEGRLKKGTPMPREYHAEYERRYYADPERRARRNALNAERRRAPREANKCKARRLTRTAIANGSLTRAPCQVCGAEPAHAHHDDYSRPLDVRWLCEPHHNEHHAKAREQGL